MYIKYANKINLYSKQLIMKIVKSKNGNMRKMLQLSP